MIKVYRSDAARIAHELAEIAEECHHDRPSGTAWRDIADMIEQLWPKPLQIRSPPFMINEPGRSTFATPACPPQSVEHPRHRSCTLIGREMGYVGQD